MSRCDPCTPEKTTGKTPQETILNPRHVGDGLHYNRNQGPRTGGKGMLAGFARRREWLQEERQLWKQLEATRLTVCQSNLCVSQIRQEFKSRKTNECH